MYKMKKQLLIILCTVAVLNEFKISSGFVHGINISVREKEKLISTLDPTVDVKQGTVKGSVELSRNGREFLSFKGIPFGKVTQRFNNAEPADPWQGTLDGKAFGPLCSQVDILTKTYRGQEDCLTLNVFVPKTEKQEILPVMVFIYGGAFVMGEANTYHPTYLMDEDVIFISINYRLGAFGFLNAGVKGASGNQAMKDLVLGLNWVQDNIQQFGGDRNKVAIFGVSAGGAAVAHLVASPMAKGLFHAAIAQSGVATVGWALHPDPEFEEPKKLAHAVDCPTSNIEFMVECLRTIRPEILAKATDFKDHVWFERAATPIFAPGIEYYKESQNDSNVFLSENIETIMDDGRFNRVPFMIGFVSHEGLSLHAAPILLSPNDTKNMNERWGRVAPQALFYWNIAKDPCTVSTKLKNTYFKGKSIGMDTADNLIALYSDMGFSYPIRKIGLKHAKYAPVYFYNFTHPVKVSYVDLFGWKHADPLSKTPTHGDDIQFLFSGLRLWPIIKQDSPDYDFSVNFVKLWTSFAKNGKPSHFWGNVESISPVNVSDTRHTWLQIDETLSVKTEDDKFQKQMSIMEDICVNDFENCA